MRLLEDFATARFDIQRLHLNREWASWVQEEEESLELIKKAYDAGINFFDTASKCNMSPSKIATTSCIA